MKKFLILLLVGLLSLSVVAARSFEFNLGASGTYNKGYNEIVEGVKPELGDFSFGLDTDVKLWLFDIQGNALYTNVNEEHILNGIVSANVSLDILMIRASAGIGYDYYYNITTKNWLVAGKDNFDNFLDNPFYLRAAAEVLIDNLHVGVFATYPTGVSLQTFFTNIQEVDWTNVLKGATFGISAKIGLL